MPDSQLYGILWDVDGTLVDTAELHFQAWQEMCRSLGLPFSRDDFAATFGRRNPEIIRHLSGDLFTEKEVNALGDRKEELYKTAARAGVDLLPGAAALLEGLHAAGFRQGIGSSAPRGNIDLILELTQTKHFFDALVSQENTQRGKPDPEVFLVGAQWLGIAPARCLVFEDAPAGIQAAKAGGMKCVGVGFVGHHSEDTLRTAGADLVVRSLEEVSVQTVRKLLR